MKKVLVVLLMAVNLGAQAFAADYYAVGVDAFNKGAYESAVSNLEHALKINPKNVNARYYLAQCYIHKKRIYDAQLQYERIIFLAPDSDAANLSYKGLALIKDSVAKKGNSAVSSELANYSDNYFDYVLSAEGKPVRWSQFPLKVYIQPKSKSSAVKKAFDKWQNSSKNLVSFNYVTNPASAQISVDFKNQLETTETKETFVAGYSKPYLKDGKMFKSEIHLLENDPDTNEPFKDENILATTLHEIGHSLGFSGHSPNEKDVMFATTREPKTELKKRDLNTLYMLYKADSQAIAQKSSGSADVKLQQALDYVKQQPDKSVGWVNLADIYRGKKMYADALKSLQKASEIEPDKADIYYLIGITYIEMGQKDKAYTYFKKSCDMDNKNSFYIVSFAKICLQTGRKDIGLKYINNYLKLNPQGADNNELQQVLKMY